MTFIGDQSHCAVALCVFAGEVITNLSRLMTSNADLSFTSVLQEELRNQLNGYDDTLINRGRR